jgi:hypothetical protein
VLLLLSEKQVAERAGPELFHMRWSLAASLVISCSAEVAEPAGLYHKIVNAHHRGELVELLNNLNLLGNAAEIGVWHAGFARHNLQHWRGKRYFMIDAWRFRSNDTSRDKNARAEDEHEVDFKIAKNVTAPWLASGRAVMLRLFAEAAVHVFPDGFFDFIYIDANHE